MWWISYRGEGKAGVENIGVFEDDGTSTQEASAAPRPVARCAPACTLPAASRWSATISTSPTPGARTAMSPATAATATRFRFADVVVTTQARFGDGPPLRRGARRRRPPLRLVPGHQHRPCHPAEDAQARAGGAAPPQELPRRKLPSRHARRLQPGPASRSRRPARRWTCRRRRASRWCSTCTASPGTPCAGSSCTASISTWRTRRGTPSRSSR